MARANLFVRHDQLKLLRFEDGPPPWEIRHYLSSKRCPHTGRLSWRQWGPNIWVSRPALAVREEPELAETDGRHLRDLIGLLQDWEYDIIAAFQPPEQSEALLFLLRGMNLSMEDLHPASGLLLYRPNRSPAPDILRLWQPSRQGA